MKIKKIEIFTYQAGWREWSFIKICTDSKISGWSECTDTFKNLNGFCGILKDFKDLILDENPLKIERIIWKLKTKSKSNPGSLVQRVISAIENTLWDINGKNNNVPVHKLIGKKLRDKIEIYWSHCGTTRVRTPQFLKTMAIKSLGDVKKFCEEINKTEFKIIKTNLAIFNDGPKIYMPGHITNFENPDLLLSDEIFKEIITWIEEINKYLNKDIYIAVDLNFNFKEDDLIRISKSLERFRIKWLEIDTYSTKSLVALRKHTNLPIVTGETIMLLKDLKIFIDEKCVDYISIDLPWTGLIESKKIAEYCNINNLKVTTHNYNGCLATAMSANFAATIPNFYIGEIDIDEVDNLDRVFSNVPTIKGRYLTVPNQPGWGCDLNEKELKKVFSVEN